MFDSESEILTDEEQRFLGMLRTLATVQGWEMKAGYIYPHHYVQFDEGVRHVRMELRPLKPAATPERYATYIVALTRRRMQELRDDPALVIC